MRRLTSIVAVNHDGVIGCRNELPWRVRSDLRFFRKMTTDNVVIMGRKTHDSLGKSLPNRYNIVLSNQLSLFNDSANCVLRYGVTEGLLAAEHSPAHFEEIFVIGGATMYSQFDDIVDRYLITIVDKKVENADAFFDVSLLQKHNDWDVTKIQPLQQEEGDEAPYEIYELNSRHVTKRRQLREARLSEFSKNIISSPRQKRTKRSPVAVSHPLLAF